jgi:ribosomal-protein-alanine N-acetyltransferase
MIVFKPLSGNDLTSVFDIALRSLSPVWSRQEYGYFLTQKAAVCFGAFVDEVMVGFVLSLKSIDELDIVAIATDTAHKRKGVGSALLRYLFDASGMRTVVLEVDRENEAAVKLYLNAGFQVVGIRKKYYQGKKDAWLMRKEL